MKRALSPRKLAIWAKKTLKGTQSSSCMLKHKANTEERNNIVVCPPPALRSGLTPHLITAMYITSGCKRNSFWNKLPRMHKWWGWLRQDYIALCICPSSTVLRLRPMSSSPRLTVPSQCFLMQSCHIMPPPLPLLLMHSLVRFFSHITGWGESKDWREFINCLHFKDHTRMPVYTWTRYTFCMFFKWWLFAVIIDLQARLDLTIQFSWFTMLFLTENGVKPGRNRSIQEEDFWSRKMKREKWNRKSSTPQVEYFEGSFK